MVHISDKAEAKDTAADTTDMDMDWYLEDDIGIDEVKHTHARSQPY